MRKIDILYRLLEKKTDVGAGIFVLNNDVREIYARIEDLQENCKHEFVDGKCLHCDKEESQ